MNRDELIAEASKRSGIGVSALTWACENLHTVIREITRKGETVTISGFGRWDYDGFTWFGESSMLPRCRVDDERLGWGEEVDAVALYLRENYDPEGFFGIGFNSMPGSAYSPVAYEKDITTESLRLSRQPNLAHIMAEILS